VNTTMTTIRNVFRRRRLIGLSLTGLAGTVLLAATTVCFTSGCSSLGYYGQSMGGHMAMLSSARPVSEWLADPATPAPLRERLVLADRLRDFAVSELKLPDNASYRRFADLQRPAAVWNVVAAPELSLVLKTWCFPVVGCVGYRGYFERPPADALADELRADGLETSVYGVPAYSTLGKLPGRYFSDPLLSTFIRYPEGDLARLIFHELAHQVAYAPGDTSFNESFATAVERIGGRRWLAGHAGEAARRESERAELRREGFRALTLKARAELDDVYRDPALDDAAKRRAKAEAMARLRAGHAALKAGPWEGFAGYDGWFERANNATLGVLGAYDDLVPRFEALFLAQGGDFERFYAEVNRIARLPREQRHAALGPGEAAIR
jgi:predicted aminopeptidase